MSSEAQSGGRSLDGGQRAAASTGVQESYYGLPVVKAPHWRWLIISYFFLGGLAGGTAVIGALNELFGRDRSITRAARYISFAATVPSPILLTLDLGRPERALNMLRIVKLKSPMSLGSWALFGLGAFTSVGAAIQLFEDVFRHEIPQGLRRFVAIAGLPFGLFISGYTGVLLAATNIPLWARNYLLMGPTFVASAFSTSLSAISLCRSFDSEELRADNSSLGRAEQVALVSEMTLLLAGARRLGRLGEPLFGRPYGKLFWPVTFVAGLLAPLALLQSSARSPSRSRATALLVLVGGYSLRALLIFAGRESARRPNDYFEYTKGSGGAS